jgi:hypothetical protein
MKKFIVLMVSALLLVSVSAFATPVFFDDFNSENGGNGLRNFNDFSQWDIDYGTVDLVGGTYFPELAYDGLSVDLDGSTGDAGRMTSIEFDVIDGQKYTFSFDIAGNQRGGANDTFQVVVYFSDYSEIFTLAADVDWHRVTREVTAFGNTAQIVFNHSGGDNVGALLDNVSLAVPEPATLLLFGSGILGLGLFRRFRK